MSEPSPAGSRPPSQRAALAVFGGFLFVGLALWFAILKPAAAPSRLPLAKKQGAAEAAPAAGQQAALPENHPPIDRPPIEIPQEVRDTIAEMVRKAEAAPKDVAAWKTAAQVQYRAGQIDRGYLAGAERAFRHVLEIDPKDLDAIRGVGNVHFDRDEYSKAVESYAAYLAIRPDDAAVRTDLGTMYLYAGDPAKALGEYQKVIAAEPNFYQAHFNLGMAYARQGDAENAKQALTRARDLAPDAGTKQQIQAVLDRATGAVAASGGAPGEPKDFHGRVEKSLREHPIVGPKIVRFEWAAPASGRVRLQSFPMQAMPEAVRQKFLDRLKGELAEARRATATAEAATLELVDDASGTVMATVKAEEGR